MEELGFLWWSCVSTLLFTWGQTMVEVMKIMVTSLKKSHACTATISAPNPAAGHHRPTPPLDTPGHSWASLGQSPVGSLLLSPGSWCTRFCLCPPRVHFPVLCKFWQLYAAAAKSLQSSDSVRPHRQQPTKLPHPWDSPGKNIGVGCHFLLQCMKVKSESEVAQSCPTLSDPMDCSLPGSFVHGIFQARVLEWGATAFSVFIVGNS